MKDFKILEERQAYKRYISVWNRRVQFPNQQVIDWDVAGHQDHLFTVVLPFDTKTKTFTLIQEYSQGPNCLMYGFASGGYEPSKHSSVLDSAQCELSEEMRLTGGEWIPLWSGDDGIPELKWGRNRFWPYLVVDPERDEQPKDRDPEEFIQIHSGISVDRLHEIIMTGELMLPSVQTAWMATSRLKEMGLL